MKQYQLKILVAVAQAGTIRGAARKLNLSQAALTKALKELELSVGVELLIRSYRGVQLTAAGKILHDRAQVAQHQLDIAQEEIQALSGHGFAQLSVGVTPMVVLSVLSEVWSHFNRLKPDVHLNLQEGLLSIVTPALLEGRLDFAVVMADASQVSAALTFEPLVSTPFFLVGRKGHPKEGATRIEELVGYEWILSMHAESYSERLLNWLRALGHPVPAKILNCNSTLINWQLVRNTDMLTVLPDVFFQSPSIGAQGSELIRFDIELPAAVLGLLRLRHAPPSASAETLADLFKLYLQKSLI